MHDDSQIDASDADDPGSEPLDAAEIAQNDLTLCLSGGGFRAAVYHLGVARRLHERGILPQIRRISCVSGGSILGAFLLQRYPTFQGRSAIGLDWQEQIEKPFSQLVCGRD